MWTLFLPEIMKTVLKVNCEKKFNKHQEKCQKCKSHLILNVKITGTLSKGTFAKSHITVFQAKSIAIVSFLNMNMQTESHCIFCFLSLLVKMQHFQNLFPSTLPQFLVHEWNYIIRHFAGADTHRRRDKCWFFLDFTFIDRHSFWWCFTDSCRLWALCRLTPKNFGDCLHLFRWCTFVIPHSCTAMTCAFTNQLFINILSKQPHCCYCLQRVICFPPRNTAFQTQSFDSFLQHMNSLGLTRKSYPIFGNLC